MEGEPGSGVFVLGANGVHLLWDFFSVLGCSPRPLGERGGAEVREGPQGACGRREKTGDWGGGSRSSLFVPRHIYREREGR